MAITYKKVVSADLANNYKNNHVTPKGKFRLIRIHKGVNNGWYFNDMVAKKQLHFYNLRTKKKYQKPIAVIQKNVDIPYPSNYVNKINGTLAIQLFVIFLFVFMIGNVLFSDEIGTNAVDKTLEAANVVANFGKDTIGGFRTTLESWKAVSIKELPQPDIEEGFLSFIGDGLAKFFGGAYNTLINIVGVGAMLINLIFIAIRIIIDLFTLLFGG